MISVDSENLPDTLAWLGSLGYTVAFRCDGWTEALAWCPGERWLGRGGTDAEALEDVLGQMLPSRAARTARVAREPVSVAAATDRAHELVETGPVVALEIVTATLDEPSADGDVHATPPAEPRSESDAYELAEESATPGEPEPASPGPEPPETTAGATTAEPAEPVEPPRPTYLCEAEAVEALEPLLDRIHAEHIELGLVVPDRQRLVILEWICHARAIEEGSGGERAVVEQVAGIARDLTSLCKLYWPGSVTALQLHTSPHRAAASLPEFRPTAPRMTWNDVAEAAERQLSRLVEADAAQGRDEYGWSDVGALKPRPLDPETELGTLRAWVEKLTGTIDAQPSKATAASVRSMRPQETARIVEWAKALRWLRGAVVDFQTWGRIAGRLRWLAAELRDDGAPIARQLDPAYRPATTWAASLGRDPVAQKRKRERQALYARLGGVGAADAEALTVWLRDALTVLDAETICRAVAPLKELVLSLDPATSSDNRGARNRLRKVQAQLAGASPDDGGATDPAQTEEPIDDTDEDEAATAVDPTAILFSAVRPHTEGRRVVFISNRNDPELEGMLTDTFGFAAIDWCEGTPRRVQAAEERIGQGAYDFVLAATGFQSHSVDGVLYVACKRADVPYVRVNKGRPVACASAIAARLGLAAG